MEVPGSLPESISQSIRSRFCECGRRHATEPPPARFDCLPVQCKVVNPILLPASFVVFSAEGFFLAVADGLYAIGRNSFLNQFSLHSFRAAGSEGDVVFLRPAVVAMPFHENPDCRMLRKEGFV